MPSSANWADSFLYYVMPFIDGETLRDKLNRETQFGIGRFAMHNVEEFAYLFRRGSVFLNPAMGHPIIERHFNLGLGFHSQHQ